MLSQGWQSHVMLTLLLVALAANMASTMPCNIPTIVRLRVVLILIAAWASVRVYIVSCQSTSGAANCPRFDSRCQTTYACAGLRRAFVWRRGGSTRLPDWRSHARRRRDRVAGKKCSCMLVTVYC